MKQALTIVVLTIFATAHANAGVWSKLYKASQYVSIGVNAIDAHSSWGHVERNLILSNSQGRFGARAVTIKAGVLGGWLLVQKLTNKQGRLNKVYAITNFGSSAVIGGVALSNYRRSK